MNRWMDGMQSRRSLLRNGATAALITGVALSSGSALAAVGRGSRLDPAGVQVLFADLQSPLVAGSATTSPAVITRSAGVLANVASVLGLPTLFSVVPETDGKFTLIPELRPYATSANTILRTPISPFHHAPTVAALARSNRKTLVIAGYATEGAVEQAALDAIAAGYTVLHAVDAMGSPSQRGEDAAFRTIEAAGSTPTSVLSLAIRLVNDFVTPPGGQIYKAILPLLGG